MGFGASEDDAAQGVGRKVADGVTQGREVVEGAKDTGHVYRHYAGHGLGEGEEDLWSVSMDFKYGVIADSCS